MLCCCHFGQLLVFAKNTLSGFFTFYLESYYLVLSLLVRCCIFNKICKKSTVDIRTNDKLQRKSFFYGCYDMSLYLQMGFTRRALFLYKDETFLKITSSQKS